MNQSDKPNWPYRLSFLIGVALFVYFKLSVNQLVWGLWFALIFVSLVVIGQCVIAASLITRAVVQKNLIADWSSTKVSMVGFGFTILILVFIFVLWVGKMYFCFLLLNFLFPLSDTFSIPFSLTDLSFYKSEVLPLWLIILASTILIDWRLAIAPILAIETQLAYLKCEETRMIGKHMLSTKTPQQDKFMVAISEIFKFYYIEITKQWVKILLICAFNIFAFLLVDAFGMPELVIIIGIHLIVCFILK